MILFVNERNEIKDVDKTDKFGLSALVVDDKDNPFIGWSKQKKMLPAGQSRLSVVITGCSRNIE